MTEAFTARRKFELGVGGSIIPLPHFFPAISSIKTNLPPTEYLRVLLTVQYPAFLLSAYDVFHEPEKDVNALAGLLKQAIQNKLVVLLDSGNYESYWRNDTSWSRERFRSVLKKYNTQLAFCFDDFLPPSSIEDTSIEIERLVTEDQTLFTQSTIIPIVHGEKKNLPDVVQRVSNRLRPLLIAVPERELGDGILERARTIHKIRLHLNSLDYYCPLHLLGTGNPLSILIYAICGADTFDGLEWCQTSVDYSSGRLFHFQQWDFFRQGSPTESLTDLPFTHRVLLHNLTFYRNWTSQISESLQTGKIWKYATNYLSDEIVTFMKAVTK